MRALPIPCADSGTNPRGVLFTTFAMQGALAEAALECTRNRVATRGFGRAHELFVCLLAAPGGQRQTTFGERPRLVEHDDARARELFDELPALEQDAAARSRPERGTHGERCRHAERT